MDSKRGRFSLIYPSTHSSYTSSMKASEVREKYLKFFEGHGHKIIPPAPLVLQNDPTTLFTSSGMQPLVPYLMGQEHPEGKRLVDSQPSIRTQDIEEVGDNRHTTFFEMLGNWSLGDYFKSDQLSWIWEFFTEELKLPKEKLWVSVFEGNNDVPKDVESFEIWKKLGVPESRIHFYDVDKNWWSRSGTPDKMPVGEIGGPDSEIFFEFTDVKHDKKFGEECHPNCDCGRFLEIGNSVFIQYKKTEKGLEELPQKNVDFGGGLERITAALNNDPDVFKIDLYDAIIKNIEKLSGKKYEDDEKSFRVIGDHLRAAAALVENGVEPSNKQQGYVLRRLIRRSALKMKNLKGSLDSADFGFSDNKKVNEVVEEEVRRFNTSLDKGLKEIQKIEKVDGKVAFDLYQSYGFPLEIIEELLHEQGKKINKEEFESEFAKHQEKSRSESAGKFKGGLADHSEETVRLHTAHHLILAALQKTVLENIKQRGSNITAERLRMDINFDRKLTEDELMSVEDLVNEKIKEELPVTKKIMPRAEAEKIGAQMEFGAKYPENVSVYFVGPEDNYFSAEFCGGPHVKNTKDLGRVKIIKQEKLGAGILRIYAKASL